MIHYDCKYSTLERATTGGGNAQFKDAQLVSILAVLFHVCHFVFGSSEQRDADLNFAARDQKEKVVSFEFRKTNIDPILAPLRNKTSRI